MDEIIYPFPKFNSATVEIWEWICNFISHFIMDVIIYPCWDHNTDVFMISKEYSSSLPSTQYKEVFKNKYISRNWRFASFFREIILGVLHPPDHKLDACSHSLSNLTDGFLITCSLTVTHNNKPIIFLLDDWQPWKDLLWRVTLVVVTFMKFSVSQLHVSGNVAW